MTCNNPIYYALVYPYFNHGYILWGNNQESLLSQLVKLQNKVVRVINNLPLRGHITPHYVNLGLIKLSDIVKLNTCGLFYDHIVDKKPSNFTLALVSKQHNYDTRPGLLEAWLVLTSVKYHGNLYILIPLNQWLALTRLRATGPRSVSLQHLNPSTGINIHLRKFCQTVIQQDVIIGMIFLYLFK